MKIRITLTLNYLNNNKLKNLYYTFSWTCCSSSCSFLDRRPTNSAFSCSIASALLFACLTSSSVASLKNN